MIKRTKSHYIFNITIDGRGLTEDEYSASVATLQSLVSGQRISCVELRRWECGTGLTGQYLLRTELDHNDFMEIRCVYRVKRETKVLFVIYFVYT